MKHRALLCAMVVAPLLCGVADGSPDPVTTAESRGRVLTRRTCDIVDRLGFEVNRGQAPEGVGFVARTRAYTASLDERGVTLSPHGPGSQVRVSAGHAAEPIGSEPRRHVVHHLGPGAAAVTDVPCVGRVSQLDVAEGVDAVWRLRGGRVELVLQVAPDADALVHVSGVTELVVGDDGAAVARAGEGAVRLSPPLAWQEGPLGRELVAVRYDLRADAHLGFVLGDMDRTRPLWIDPQLDYLTYLGSDDNDGFNAGPAIDAQGRAVVAFGLRGGVSATSGAFQSDAEGDRDVFVATLTADGDDIAWATYLGGSEIDFPLDLALAADGSICVVGSTRSDDFPVESALLDEPDGVVSGFLSRLTSDGRALVHSTYVEGGPVTSLAVGPQGRAHVGVGELNQDVLRYAADGSDIDWTHRLTPGAVISTPERVDCRALAVGADGRVFVGGTIYNVSGRPDATDGAYQTSYGGGPNDGFLVAIESDGDREWATFLGGSSNDEVTDVAVDAAGFVVAAGWTRSTGFPTTAGTAATTHAGQSDAFVVRFHPAGDALRWATLLGGSDVETHTRLTLHATGRVFVAGATYSTDFPLSGAFQSTLGNATDCWVGELTPSGGLAYASYLGGSSYDWLRGAAVDAAGALHVYGDGGSSDLATTTGAFQEEKDLSYDTFVGKVAGTVPSGVSAATLDAELLEATRGRPYTSTIALSGGQGPFVWVVYSGAVPPGLTLGASTGAVTGTPTAAGTFPFHADVTGSYGIAATPVVLVVNEPPLVAGDGFPPWTAGVPMDVTLAVDGGTSPFEVIRLHDELPPGTTLLGDGRLVGTPATPGRHEFEVELFDHWDAYTTGDVALVVNPAVEIVTGSLPDATEGRPYGPVPEATGGTGALTWSRVSGALPVDGAVDAVDGALGGVAHSAGTYAFTLRAADTVGGMDDASLDVVVNPPPVVTTDALPPAALDRPYTFALAVDGGTPGFLWQPEGDGLPAGIGFDATTGEMDGAPSVAGSRLVRFVCRDMWDAEAVALLDLVVAAPADLAAKAHHREDVDFTGAEEPRPLIRHVELVAGSTLDVAVKRLGKAKGPAPFELEVLDGSGDPLDVRAFLRSSKKVVRIRKMPIETTGRYFIRLTADRPAIGKLRLDVKAKAPAKHGDVLALDPAGEPVVLHVGAVDGATLALDVRPDKRSDAVPLFLVVEDAAGNDLLATGKRKTKKGRDSLKVVVPVGGEIRVEVGAAPGSGAGSVRWSAKTKLRKGYPLTLPDLPSGR